MTAVNTDNEHHEIVCFANISSILTYIIYVFKDKIQKLYLNYVFMSVNARFNSQYSFKSMYRHRNNEIQCHQIIRLTFFHLKNKFLHCLSRYLFSIIELFGRNHGLSLEERFIFKWKLNNLYQHPLRTIRKRRPALNLFALMLLWRFVWLYIHIYLYMCVYM